MGCVVAVVVAHVLCVRHRPTAPLTTTITITTTAAAATAAAAATPHDYDGDDTDLARLEVDLLMGSFAVKYVPTMTLEEMQAFERILTCETVDIFQYISGQKAPPEVGTC